MNKVAFRVYDKDNGDLLFEGAAKMCAERFQMSESSFRDAAERGYFVAGKYKVEKYCTDGVTMKDLDAIESWNKFCEPLREKFGVPVYKAKSGSRR